MASRKEQKERARAERLAKQERAAAQARRRRLSQLGGGALALVIVVVVVAAVAPGGGESSAVPTLPSGGGPPIPAQKISDLSAAAKAAGCTLSTYPNFGQQHTTATVKYKTNPPTSGPHNPTPAHDGDYVGKGTPPVEMLVHPLEHGRVEIQYRAGTPLRRQRQLETLLAEPIVGQPAGFDQLLFENNTGMPYPIAATAWQNLLACPTFNDQVFDALRAFRAQYVNRGPEANIPYPE
jgi:Protein of unknown function (DUF3105)